MDKPDVLDERLEFIPNVYHLPKITQRIHSESGFIFYEGARYGEPVPASRDCAAML